jgi:amidophosphoribosyltransferase
MIDEAGRPREECGVIAVIRDTDSVTGHIVDGLHTLQHRGQEAAGLAVSDGAQMLVVKDTGLVADVLNSHTVGFLAGNVGIGHVRYSTSGNGAWENAQPSFRATPRNVRFPDGLEWTVFEDELSTTRESWYRPDPPRH